MKEDEEKETHSVCFFPSFDLLCLFSPASNIPPSQAIRQTFRCSVYWLARHRHKGWGSEHALVGSAVTDG